MELATTLAIKPALLINPINHGLTKVEVPGLMAVIYFISTEHSIYKPQSLVSILGLDQKRQMEVFFQNRIVTGLTLTRYSMSESKDSS